MWRHDRVTSWLYDELTVTSWLYDELTVWRFGHVKSWRDSINVSMLYDYGRFDDVVILSCDKLFHHSYRAVICFSFNCMTHFVRSKSILRSDAIKFCSSLIQNFRSQIWSYNYSIRKRLKKKLRDNKMWDKLFIISNKYKQNKLQRLCKTRLF